MYYDIDSLPCCIWGKRCVREDIDRVGCGEALFSINRALQPTTNNCCFLFLAALIGLILNNHEYSHTSHPLYRPTDRPLHNQHGKDLSHARPTHASLISGSVNKRAFKARRSPFAPRTIYNPRYGTVLKIIIACTEQQSATPGTSRYLKKKIGRG